MDKPMVYDRHGQEQDWSWLLATFGAIVLERAQVPPGIDRVFRVVKLQENEGPAAQIVTVADLQGSPLEGVTVVRSWPGGPPMAGWPPPASMWRDRGVSGPTNVRGEIGFGLGRGDYYYPPSGGASSVWVADSCGPSDLISGLGMLGATQHRHMDVFFQIEPTEVPAPSPQPPPGPSALPFAIVDEAGHARDLDWLAAHFGVVEHQVAPEPSAYRLAELRRADGGDELIIRVLDQNDNPLAGIPVSFRRRDGTAGLSRETGPDGMARFVLGDDARYPLPGQGPYLARVKAVAGASDLVVGLGQVEGMLGHLDITFRFEPGQAAPSPAPSPPAQVDARWQQVFRRLDAIIAVLEERTG